MAHEKFPYAFLKVMYGETHIKRNNDHGITTVISSPMIMEEANIKDFVSKRYSTVRP